VENLDFLLNCILIFAVVFLVLSVLSFSIRIITIIFPDKSIKNDNSAVIAAITTHLNQVYPNTHTIKIEEQK